jgi:hypothetical protein
VSPFVMNFVGDVNHMPANCQVGLRAAGSPACQPRRAAGRPALLCCAGRVESLVCPDVDADLAARALPACPAACAQGGIPDRQALCHVPPWRCVLKHGPDPPCKCYSSGAPLLGTTARRPLHTAHCMLPACSMPPGCTVQAAHCLPTHFQHTRLPPIGCCRHDCAQRLRGAPPCRPRHCS